MAVRDNYASLGGWTEEEYLHFWEGERRMESIISGGAFWIAIEKGIHAAEVELQLNKTKEPKTNILKKIIKKLWHKALTK